MIIQQIRNATLKIQYGDVTFLIDPWLQDKGTGFSANSVRPEMQGVKCPMNELPCAPDTILKGVDFCLVTHLHFDHFSKDYLPKDLRIIAQNENDAESIRQMGFEDVQSFDSEEIEISGITIRKTKAIHGENDAVVKKMGEVYGYVFEAPGEKCLYLAADTVYCDEVESTIERFSPETIILNCCGATVPLGRLIMDADDVKKVCRKSPEALVVATHLDSVNHALYTSEDIKNYIEKEGLVQVRVPANGEAVEI